MALSIEHVNSLQVEIVNLEFKKEIFKYQDEGTVIGMNEYEDGLEAREVQITKLRGRLDQLIVSLPTTEQMACHSQPTCSFVSSLPYDIPSAIFMKGPIDVHYLLP